MRLMTPPSELYCASMPPVRTSTEPSESKLMLAREGVGDRVGDVETVDQVAVRAVRLPPLICGLPPAVDVDDAGDLLRDALVACGRWRPCWLGVGGDDGARLRRVGRA